MLNIRYVYILENIGKSFIYYNREIFSSFIYTFILVSKNVCASYANAEDYDCSEYARYKHVKRGDFDANHRPESLCESSRFAKKTRIVVMTTKELEVLRDSARLVIVQSFFADLDGFLHGVAGSPYF